MITIKELSLRLAGRLIIDGASASVPARHRVGLVGRNGSGKTTLLRLIAGELAPEQGSVNLPRNARIGTVAQEAPAGETSLLATVLQADRQRSHLLAELESTTDAHRIAEIHIRLADIGAHSAPARAATILAGLGFAQAAQDGPCSRLSGGWRMRVALAAVLFSDPDILLLDEPTNYLDLEGTIWLKSFIRNYRHTVLVVSHDRDFLNHAVNSILHLERGKLHLYSGDFDSFEQQRREKQFRLGKLREKQEGQRRHMQAFVDRFRYKQSKARQAQSRLKAIARMERIAEMIEDRVLPFSFPGPAKPLSPPLIRFEGVAVGYQPAQPVLRNIQLRIDPDDRIALLGRNGNGKSTFAKLLCGQLPIMAGAMSRHPKLITGYFAQHQLDELDGSRSPYDYLRSLMPRATEAQRRARLGAYGFGSELSDTKCAALSGGETARLLFALAGFHAPHLLILDEPTNHLDIDSRTALVQALNDYPGAVVLISHDRHLIETTADRLLLVADGTVGTFEGDLDDYTEYVLERIRTGSETLPINQSAAAAPKRTPEVSGASRRPAAPEWRRCTKGSPMLTQS